MSDSSKSPDGEGLARRVEKEIVFSPDLRVDIREEITRKVAAEMEERLALEEERLTLQQTSEKRIRDLVLGTLGAITGAASLLGLAASVAVGPALVPAAIVAATYLLSKLPLAESERTKRAKKPTPPVLASLGEDLARDREVIRCFSPREPLPILEEGGQRAH